MTELEKLLGENMAAIIGNRFIDTCSIIEARLQSDAKKIAEGERNFVHLMNANAKIEELENAISQWKSYENEQIELTDVLFKERDALKAELAAAKQRQLPEGVEDVTDRYESRTKSNQPIKHVLEIEGWFHVVIVCSASDNSPMLMTKADNLIPRKLAPVKRTAEEWADDYFAKAKMQPTSLAQYFTDYANALRKDGDAC